MRLFSFIRSASPAVEAPRAALGSVGALAAMPACARCGADTVVPDARLDHGSWHQTSGRGLLASIAVRPRDPVFQDIVGTPVQARVCATCGFVELYATNPGPIWAAHQRRLARRDPR